MPLKPEQPEEGVAAHLFAHLAGQQVHGTGDRGERAFGHRGGGGWQQSPDPSRSIGPEQALRGGEQTDPGAGILQALREFVHGRHQDRFTLGHSRTWESDRA